jgi:molecular chaperone GrpE (heat shock protein)
MNLSEEEAGEEQQSADDRSATTSMLEEAMVASSSSPVETEGEEDDRQADAAQLGHDDGGHALTDAVDRLARLVDEANDLSRYRERTIDRLHQENQELKSGQLWQAVVPVFRDLIRLYDDLNLTAQKYGTVAGANEVASDFHAFRDAVEDVLYRHGVERYGAEEGLPFNSKEHKAVGVVNTQNESQDRAICRVIRSGFRTEARMVRTLEAEVFRFAPSNESLPEEAALPAKKSDELIETEG